MNEASLENPILTVSDLTVRISRRHLFNNVSFEIKPASFSVIRGSNGVGKTTLLRTIAGLHREYSGTVSLKSGTTLGIASSTSTFMYEDLSVRENLRIVLGDDFERSIFSEQLMDKPLSTLSSGERALASMARIYGLRPSLILLDEVTSNLDTNHRESIFVNLHELVKAGSAVILVTHEAFDNADVDTEFFLTPSGIKKTRG